MPKLTKKQREQFDKLKEENISLARSLEEAQRHSIVDLFKDRIEEMVRDAVEEVVSELHIEL